MVSGTFLVFMQNKKRKRNSFYRKRVNNVDIEEACYIRRREKDAYKQTLNNGRK